MKVPGPNKSNQISTIPTISGYTLTERETRNYPDNCQKITQLNLKTNTRYYSGAMYSYLWMTISQGSIHCTTSRPPGWYSIKTDVDITVDARNLNCNKYFNKDLPVEIKLHSDSSNEVSVVRMGVRIGQNTWKYWTNSGGVWINYYKNNGPHIAS